MELSAMLEELSPTEKSILKQSATDYIHREGLQIIDNLSPLSGRCSTTPCALFVSED